tara:strand:+ start:2664 stop:5006 length:2343 start_codon:yes stop_codon:yes gene_type:complete
MASQYTKDITKSKVYKQATGQDKKFVDEAIEGLGLLKKLGNEKVTANMKTLQDQEIFNIQRTKSNLMNLNKFGEYEKDLQDNYNGDIDLYAKAQAKKIIDQRALLNFPVSDTDKAKLTVNHPDAAYGKTLDKAAADFKGRYLSLREGLNDKGIPFKGSVAEANTFIDTAYQGVFDATSKENNYRVMDGVKSLFTGQGLNYSSAKDLKSSYDKNVATSNISSIKKLNDSFKALYNFDPKIADEMAVVVNKADVRKDVVETALVKKTRVSQDQTTGQSFTLYWAEKDITYTDKDGKPQIETIKTPESRVDDIKLANVTEIELFSKLIIDTQDSQEAFQGLLSEGYTARYAFEALDKKFKVGISNAGAEQFRRENAIKLQEGWNAYQKDMWYIKDNLTGAESLRKDIKAFTNGTGPRPSDLQFASFAEYQESIAPIKAYINKDNMRGPDVAELDFNLTNSSDWKEYFDSVDGQSDIRDFKDAVISDDQFLNELKTEFNSGDFTRVDANGNYFPTNDKGYIPLAELTKMGLGNVYSKPQEIGFNVNSDRTIFKNAVALPQEVEEIDTSNLEESDKSWATKLLQTVNDVPILGAVTELALGEEIDAVDALWLIPGIGWVGGGAKIALSGAAKYGTKKLLASKKGSEMLSKITAQYNKTRQVQVKVNGKVVRYTSGPNKGKIKMKSVPAGKFFGFNSKAQYDSWYKGLTAIEKAMANSISKRGGAIDIKKFTESWSTLRGTEFVAKIPGANNKIVRYLNTGRTIPVSTALVGRQYAFSDDPSETPE